MIKNRLRIAILAGFMSFIPLADSFAVDWPVQPNAFSYGVIEGEHGSYQIAWLTLQSIFLPDGQHMLRVITRRGNPIYKSLHPAQREEMMAIGQAQAVQRCGESDQAIDKYHFLKAGSGFLRLQQRLDVYYHCGGDPES